MFKLKSKYHGVIDYLVVIFLMASPIFFRLPELTSRITYILAGIHLALTVLTDFELGFVKVIPFRVHGWIELIVSVALAALAIYLGSIEGALSRTFYLSFAGAVFFTWAITDYRRRRHIP